MARELSCVGSEPHAAPGSGAPGRSGSDPTGNLWWIATRLEEVPPEEMARREKEFIEGLGRKAGG